MDNDLECIYPITDADYPSLLKQNPLKCFDDNGCGRIYENKKIWKKAAWKACHANSNLWEDFDLNIKTEEGIRHKYNPITASWTWQKAELKLEDEPFDSGAQRICYRLKKIPTEYDKFGQEIVGDLSDNTKDNNDRWKNASNYVAKRYKSNTSKSTYIKDIQLQMDAKLWGEEYNRHKPPKPIDIIQSTLLEIPSRTKHKYYHLERFIEGDYVKYNSNTGFVCDENTRLTPQAFSHFTFERSGHSLIIVDIQGVDDLWTDPQIHTVNGIEYTEGNMGIHGMALFFHSHICNKICHNQNLSTFDLSPNEKAIHEAHTKSMESSETCLRVDEMKRCHPQKIEINLENACSDPTLDVLNEAETQNVETIFHKMSYRHRSSCIRNEIGILETKLMTLDNVPHETSTLGQVHLELCKCHENGRFVCDINPKPDHISAFYHLELAAKCHIVEACYAIANIYLKLPSEILDGYEPPQWCDEGKRLEKGLFYMKAAARGNNRNAIIHLADMHENGAKLNGNDEAIHWYTKAIVASNDDAGEYPDTSNDDYPIYRLYAKLGYLHKMGGNDFEPCFLKAASYYNKAAEIAMNKMKGKLANEYFMMAENCCE